MLANPKQTEQTTKSRHCLKIILFQIHAFHYCFGKKGLIEQYVAAVPNYNLISAVEVETHRCVQNDLSMIELSLHGL